MPHDTHLSAAHGFGPDGPELTFPSEVAAWVTSHYETADVILEYGSGGSTVLAAGMTGKTVFAVENAKDWYQSMQAWFAQNPPVSDVRLHRQNVGATKAWGFPVDESKWRNYPAYPLSVWQRDDFVHPDVVLIDGRFRAACFLATLFSIRKPVTVLFDDYVPRADRYAICESFAEITETRGRMVKFNLDPATVPAHRLLEIFQTFQRPL